MNVAVGFDHAGYPLRDTVLKAVRDAGVELIDMGTNSPDQSISDFVSQRWPGAIQTAERSADPVCGSALALH
jgi:ribose 5-phosphate isomerase B